MVCWNGRAENAGSHRSTVQGIFAMHARSVICFAGDMPRVYRSGWRRRSRFSPTPLSAVEWAKSHGIHLWSKQQEICESVDAHKLTACKGGHQWGKSMTTAVVAAHWIDSHPRDEVGVIIIAPSWDQIVDGVLLEIDKLRVECRLPGKINLSKNHANWTIDGRKVLMCRSPQARRDRADNNRLT